MPTSMVAAFPRPGPPSGPARQVYETGAAPGAGLRRAGWPPGGPARPAGAGPPGREPTTGPAKAVQAEGDQGLGVPGGAGGPPYRLLERQPHHLDALLLPVGLGGAALDRGGALGQVQVEHLVAPPGRGVEAGHEGQGAALDPQLLGQLAAEGVLPPPRRRRRTLPAATSRAPLAPTALAPLLVTSTTPGRPGRPPGRRRPRCAPTTFGARPVPAGLGRRHQVGPDVRPPCPGRAAGCGDAPGTAEPGPPFTGSGAPGLAGRRRRGRPAGRGGSSSWRTGSGQAVAAQVDRGRGLVRPPRGDVGAGRPAAAAGTTGVGAAGRRGGRRRGRGGLAAVVAVGRDLPSERTSGAWAWAVDRSRPSANAVAAPTKSRNRGWGRVGRERNSGWNWPATNHRGSCRRCCDHAAGAPVPARSRTPGPASSSPAPERMLTS